MDLEGTWIHPDDRDHVLSTITSSIEKGEPYSLEYRNYRQNDGDLRYLHVETQLEDDQIAGDLTYYGTVQDITERKQYEESLQRRVNELNILQQVSAICLENTDENNTIAEITNLIGKSFYPDHFGIMILDDHDNLLKIHPSYQGLAKGDHSLEIKLGVGVAGQVAQNNCPLRIADVSSVAEYIAPTVSQQSELCVPIAINGKVYGVINAESSVPAFFNEEDERLLVTVADQLALALQKSRLYEEEKQRRQEAEANRAASIALTSSLELSEVLDNILDNLRKVIRSDQASIHLFENNHIKIVAGNGFSNPEEVIGFTYPFDNKLALEVYKTKRALVLDDAHKDPRFQNFGLVNTRGWMGIPLIEQDEVIGYLTIDSNQPGAYTEYDAEQVQVFANNATGAIVKARLFEEEKKRRLEAEIQQEISSTMANSLQLDTVLNSALSNLQRFLDYDSAGIMLQENGYMRIVAVLGFEKPDELLNKLVPVNHQLYQEIKKTKKALIIDDVMQDERFEDFGADFEIKGWMGVPLIDQGRVIGYVSFDSKQSGKFSDDMGRLAQVLVNHTASAITKAKLFEDTQLGLKRLEALHEIDRIITSSVELNFSIKQIMQIVVNQLEIDAASVVMYEQNSSTFTPINSIGFKSGDYDQLQLFGNGFASKVALMRKTILIEDQDEILKQYNNSESILQEGFICYLGVPLIAKGEIKGVLELFHRSPLLTTNEWEGFLDTLATQLAISIDNSQMFDNLQRSNLELTLSYDATIEGWAKTLELRDQETQGHSERVTAMTVKLARAMGMIEKELIHIRRGALLHDVGKIGIPDSILQKPDQLDEEERQVMENHPALAYNVLSGSVFLEKALDIPYCHHEKWDGTGYPRQLMGDEIPLSARVFAIIDVYDALRSKRPYRDAWSKAKTIKYIKKQSGSHFDPKVAEVFLGLVDQDPDFDLYD
jgi:HD-GYP domain-containing protein (c-di-GMP phosphodiesterase class II)